MKNLLLINVFVILLSGLILSCNSDEMYALNEMSSISGSGFRGGDLIVQAQPFYGPEIPLLNKQNVQVGNLMVFSTATKLKIEYVASDPWSILEIQLWVGTDLSDVPMNKNMAPLPGKFTYKASGQEKYRYEIMLADLLPNYGILFDGIQPVLIFAHAKVKNADTGVLESVWSEGNTFGTTRWGTYSEFMCQLPTGGGGCFPHFAQCGSVNANGNYFYVNAAGGKQNIIADNGTVVGTVENQNGDFVFDFYQTWMFSGLTPEIVVYGYTDTNSPGQLLHSGAPQNPTPPFYYYVTLDNYDYYSFELQLQYCTTQ